MFIKNGVLYYVYQGKCIVVCLRKVYSKMCLRESNNNNKNNSEVLFEVHCIICYQEKGTELGFCREAYYIMFIKVSALYYVY